MSRAYVIENRIDADGRLVGTMRHEWCAPGVSSQFGNPVLEAVPWDGGFARWAAAHARGEPVFGLVADMPEAERTEIEAQDIVSIAEHPVFVGDEWWGAIGFDDCERERRWASELDALRAAATVLGAPSPGIASSTSAGRPSTGGGRWSSTSLLSRTPTSSSRPTRCAWSS